MQEEIRFTDIVKFFIKNKVTISYITILGFLCGLIFAILKTKEYTSEAGIIVLNRRTESEIEPKIKIKDLTEGAIQRFEDRKKSVQELIKTPEIINRVITKLYKIEDLKYVDLDKYKDYEEFLSFTKVKQVGEVIKINVTLQDPKLAKFFVDEIANSTVEYLNQLLFYDISNHLDKKIADARLKYQQALDNYNKFLKTNQIMKINSQIENLKQIYNYYNSQIVGIKKYIWELESLKKQIENNTNSSSVVDFSNFLSLLMMKSKIFYSEKEVPLKLDLSVKDYSDFKERMNMIKDIDNLLDVLQKKLLTFKKELEEQKFEQKIQNLQKDLEKEKMAEKELLVKRDLSWETLTTLERKKEEFLIVRDLVEDFVVKVAYYGTVPKRADPGKRLLIIFSFTFIGFIFSIIVVYFKDILMEIR